MVLITRPETEPVVGAERFARRGARACCGADGVWEGEGCCWRVDWRLRLDGRGWLWLGWSCRGWRWLGCRRDCWFRRGSTTLLHTVPNGGSKWAGIDPLDDLPEVLSRELEIRTALPCSTSVADISDEHVWEGGHIALVEDLTVVVAHHLGDGAVVVDEVAFFGGALHCDGRAVHIHLPLADLVEPGEGESIIPGCDLRRDAVLELVGAVAEGVFADVARVLGGTAALD